MNDHCIVMQANDEYIFTIRNPANIQGKVAIGVSYEAFVDDVQVSMTLGRDADASNHMDTSALVETSNQYECLSSTAPLLSTALFF